MNGLPIIFRSISGGLFGALREYVVPSPLPFVISKMAKSKRHGGQQKRSKKSVNKAKSSKKRQFKELKEKHSVDEE